MAGNTTSLHTSSKDVFAMAMDRCILEQLLMMMLFDSLRRRDEIDSASGNCDDDSYGYDLREIVEEGMKIMLMDMERDQSVFSHERLDVTQRLLETQILHYLMDKREGEGGRAAVPSESLVSSDQHLVDTATAAADEAAEENRHDHEQNKVVAAKQKMIKLKSSSLIMTVVLIGSIMTLSPPLSLILQTDATGEGEAPPAMPPYAASMSSLRRKQKDHRTDIGNNAPSTSSEIISPLSLVVPPPVFSPAAVAVSTASKSDSDPHRLKAEEKVRVRSSTCMDTLGWKDIFGEGCDYYEEYFDPGCPNADSWAGEMGPATTHCCFCQHETSTLRPTVDSSESPRSSSQSISLSNSTQFCEDSPNWEDRHNNGCDHYEETKGCADAEFNAGDMGPATEHCCFCQGGSSTCEDFRSKCQDYFDVLGIKDGVMSPLCEEAESCSCGGHDVEIATDNMFGLEYKYNVTVGLFDECKCDFWSRLCEDSDLGAGEACDYAAEYCCGEYGHSSDFLYANSALCYCDFFNYAQNEFQHALKPKTMNIDKDFRNPCDLFKMQRLVDIVSNSNEDKTSLKAIFENTGGDNWRNNDGWMNETVHHCQWYGISCSVEGRVTRIELRDNNLAGQFPVYTRKHIHPDGTLLPVWYYTKYGLANLFKLETIDLAGNTLQGTIDYRSIYNLPYLVHFDVSENQLSGEITALVTHSIRHSDFSNNKFTSMNRFEKYKRSYQTLRFCNVSNNAIHISATDLLDSLPPNIDQLFAQNNQIYGSLPKSMNNLPKLLQFNMSNNLLSGSISESLNHLPRLRKFDISSNNLTGQLPDFVESILSLQVVDLSNQTAGFTGTIPEDLGTFQSLRVLKLAGNKLTGTIPSSIGNIAVLEMFDLSNNLLHSTIPPELGLLKGIMKRLDLSRNILYGRIPSEVGQLRGASILLKGNQFYSSSEAAPLSLCTLRFVEDFDLANDIRMCPIERNALSDFYDSAKGAEWKDGTNWQDEYASYCDWKGVTCDNNTNHVTKLSLSHNGLSGSLSESIGDLISIEVLDLSDNDIKGSIPSEIGLLSNLTYLRLSYNAFGVAPEGLSELTQLQLLHLQSNRITEIPNISRLDESTFNKSAFVTDCGVPSAFDKAPACETCTMCCNANEDCYPQAEENSIDFVYAAIILIAGFVASCCVVVLNLFFFNKRKKDKNKGRRITLSMTMKKRRQEEEDKYALSRIGNESVYSYFVTESRVGWVVAFTTLVVQGVLLMFFVLASMSNLQDDKIDIKFSWKCPRDADVCKDYSDLKVVGWVIFAFLMIAHLAKDFINGSKLMYHSSKVRNSLGSRIRYFIGGVCLCSITLFALYVSVVYNWAIARSNTDIIVNSVILLFVMDLDERVFATLEAWNENWTAHASDSKPSRTLAVEAGNNGAVIEEMKLEIAWQKAQIADQQKEIELLRSQQEELMLQKYQVAGQKNETHSLFDEAVQNMHDPLASAGAASESNESVTVTTHRVVSLDTSWVGY